MFRLPKHTKMVHENFYYLMLKQIYIIILSTTIFTKGILSCAPPSTGPPFSSSAGASSRFYGQSRASRQQFYPSPTIIDVQQHQQQHQQQFPFFNGDIQQLIPPRFDDTYLKEKQTMQQQTFDSREHFLNDFGNNDIDAPPTAAESPSADQNLLPPVNSSDSSDLSLLLEPSSKATQPTGAYLNKLKILPSPQMAAAFKQENDPISHENQQKLPSTVVAADDKSSSSGLFVPLDCPQNGVHNYTELLNCLEVEVKPFDGLASHSAGHELPAPSPEQNCQFEDDIQEEKCSFYSTVDGSLQFNLGRLDAIADLKNHRKFAESFALLMRRPSGDLPEGNFLVLIEPEGSNNPRSDAILKMDVLCQRGDGRLAFSYWCTYEHFALKVCTRHGHQRDCTTQIFYTPESSKAEINVVNPAPTSSDENSRFTVEIIASGFNEPAILLLDNLRYEANPCIIAEAETHQQNPKSNVERIDEAKIFTPNLNILPIVRVEDEELEMFTQPDSPGFKTLSAQQNAVKISDRQEKKITQVPPSEILSEEAPWLNRNLFTSAPKMWPLPIKNKIKNGSSGSSKNGWHQLMESSPFQREMLKLMGAGQQQNAAHQQQHSSRINAAANNLRSSPSLMSDEKLEEKKPEKTSVEVKKEQQKHKNGKLVDGEVGKKWKWWQQQQDKNMNTKEQEEKGLWRHVEKDGNSNRQEQWTSAESVEKYESKLHRPLLLFGRRNEEQQQKRMRLVPILRRRKQPLSACELLECTFNTGFCHYTQIENGGKYRLGKWRIARPLPTNINMRSREASSYSSIENITSAVNNNSLQYFGYAYVGGGYASKGQQHHHAIGKKSDEQTKSKFTVNRFGRTLYILQSPDISLNSNARLKFDVFQRSAAVTMPTKLQICLNSMMRCVYEKMFPSTDDEDHHSATAAGDVDGWRRDKFVELPAETKRIFIVATQWKNNGNGASDGWLAIDNIRLEAQTITTKQNEQQNCSL